MADTRLSDLHPAGALSASDLFYVVQNPGSGGEKATGTQLLTLVGTTYLAKAGGTMTGALTIASGTLTASAPGLSITQTWNNAGVVFNALSIVTTNTASSSTSKFASFSNSDGGIINFFKQGWIEVGNASARSSIDFTGVTIGSTSALGFSSNALASAAQDTYFSRDVAGGMGLRNGANQQSFCVYNNESSSLTNYERLKLTGVAGTSVNITAESLGTGSPNLDVVITPKGTGNVLLPTGHLFLKVSTARIEVSSAGAYQFSAGTAGQTGADVAFRRSAIGVVDVDSGTAGAYRDLKLRNLIQTEYQQMTEMTAPSAPATNSVRIYAEDNGSGKTRLMALFASGAAQQIAIEP